MNYKKMLVLEYLLDKFVNTRNNYEYSMVFKLGDSLYTGDFLQLAEPHSDDKRVIFKHDSYRGYRTRPFMLRDNKDGNMGEMIKKRFEQMHLNELELIESEKEKDYYYSSLLDSPEIFLNALIEFVLNIDVDDYLDHSFIYTNTIHNLQSISNENEYYELYRLDAEVLQPAYLIKNTL